MKKVFLFLATFLMFYSIFAQNKNDIEKYNSKKTQYGFIENKGQIYDQNYKANPDVKYLLCLGNGMNVQLKGNSFSYDTYRIEIKDKEKAPLTANMRHDKKEIEKDITYYYHRVDVKLVGANTNPEIIAEEPSTDYQNYYNAVTPESGATYVHNYKKITYKDIYKGIDMVFMTEPINEKPVEYLFIVYPGADVRQIQLHYKGANNTQLSENKITVDVAHGSFTENIPASWIKETNNKVSIAYINIMKDIYGFEIPAYLKTQTLIIDPNPNFDWGTYFGGSSDDVGTAITCENMENVLITGYTTSNNAIATTGAYQTTYSGNQDAFVAKFSNTGILQWGTYYGDGGTRGNGIACDSSGNVFTTGSTTSTYAIASTGAYQTTLGGGGQNAFVVKFDNNGVRQWGTYYGGGSENGNGIACDGTGNVFITGETSIATEIASTGAYQTTIGGGEDAFVVKFNTNGVRQWGTYYGGSGDDQGNGIVCDKIGNVFITGGTQSTNAIASNNAYQTAFTGYEDAFIVKFNTNGIRQWGTYYGGYLGSGIASDSSGNVYITGMATTTTGIATTGAYQTTYGGGDDVFVTKFNNNGVLQWGTYYGGSAWEQFGGIACDKSGNVYITGITQSTSTIATIGAYQTIYGGGGDVYIAKFNSIGAIQWGTYYGGTGSDYGMGITCDDNGNVFITGNTNSTSNIATSGAYQDTLGGSSDAFIAKFVTCNFPANADTITGLTTVCKGQSTVTYTIPAIANATSYQWSLPYDANGSSTTNSISVDYGSSAVSGNITVTGNNSCGNGVSSSLAITVNTHPANAGTITGNTNVCQSQNTVIYTVPAIADALTYNWTLPSGATGISTTNTITVNYSTSAVTGNITVNGNNLCGDGVNSSLAITVKPLPVSAGTIIGDSIVCQGQNSITYTIPTIANAITYIWTLPTGAVGTSTTKNITVNYNSSAVSGSIYVNGNNSCGNGANSSLFIDVNPLPSNAGSISGANTVCQGQNSEIYTLPIIANTSSYIWLLPTGAIGSSSTDSITVNFGNSAISGNIYVNGHNSCGDGISSSFAITVNPIPPIPIISQTGNTLHSSATSGNQWYNATSGIISSATAQTYNPIVNGYYYVIITLNGCSSDSSNHYYYSNVGIEENENNNIIKVYPNPVSNELVIEIEGNKEKVTFEIFNSIGQSIYKGNLIEKTTVQTTNFAQGVYLIKLNNGKTFEFKKIVKE